MADPKEVLNVEVKFKATTMDGRVVMQNDLFMGLMNLETTNKLERKLIKANDEMLADQQSDFQGHNTKKAV